MKRIIFRSHGTPEEVVELIEEPDPTPGPGEVRVRNKVMTINPADLLTIEGRYGAEPIALPFTPGFGAYGIVDAVGDGVTRLSPGDPVLPLGGGLWSDTVIVHERMAPRAPLEGDIEQIAMMRANPATAYLMIQQIIELSPGDWLVQNASNSAVGRLVIRFARQLGYHTINIVRRADVADGMRSDGADVVLVDDGTCDISEAIRASCGSAPKLALDAIGGDATALLASAVANGGTVVVYGLLSGMDSRLGARDLVFRDVRVQGFWLSHWFASADPDDIRDLNGFLAEQLEQGVSHAQVEARYPLHQIKQAVSHAAKSGRKGKILLIGDDHA